MLDKEIMFKKISENLKLKILIAKQILILITFLDFISCRFQNYFYIFPKSFYKTYILCRNVTEIS